MAVHSIQCNCNACSTEPLTSLRKLEHITASENSRRDFLKKFSLSFAMAGLPLAASALNSSDSEKQSEEMFRNQAIKNGKANIVTILHTADIHAQLLTHDEFFIENGKPVYKKRGGYAVLKTMIDELRNQYPGNTMLIDGGD
jgi:sulfur-oxidizing protein SoxB